MSRINAFVGDGIFTVKDIAETLSLSSAGVRQVLRNSKLKTFAGIYLVSSDIANELFQLQIKKQIARSGGCLRVKNWLPKEYLWKIAEVAATIGVSKTWVAMYFEEEIVAKDESGAFRLDVGLVKDKILRKNESICNSDD